MNRPTKREVVLEALHFRTPPYVPWSLGVKADDGEHLWCCPPQGSGDYGVVYAPRTEQFQMAMAVGHPLKRPEDLATYRFPRAYEDAAFEPLEEWRKSKGLSDRFSMVMLGGTLFELAWALRGMEPLLTDMAERPEFVEELLDAITAHRLEQIHQALRLTDFDGVWFGDDYGMQTGILMGASHWRHFIKPRLRRLFEPVRDAGKFVYLHSCGKVQTILDDLVEIGLNIFNPFQPEVMDVFDLLARYHGRLAFHGGMGVQSILPHGTPEEVGAMTQRLIDAGRRGGYIFSPSHSIGPDVPQANIDAMLEVLRRQPGFGEAR
jgi:uroporphyrinogen decarboxylase